MLKEERHLLFIERNPTWNPKREYVKRIYKSRDLVALRKAVDKYNSNPENRLKILARRKVNRAIRDGKINKSPCSRCPCLTAQAHHPDYNKPLDIVWLCTTCHGIEHRNNV